MPLPNITALPPVPTRSMAQAEFSLAAEAYLAAINTFRTELMAYGSALASEAATIGYSANSTTAFTAGVGSKTFTIQTGRLFVVGQYVTIASAAAPSLQMQGYVTAHNSSTGSLTVQVISSTGVGSAADWVLGVSGPSAAGEVILAGPVLVSSTAPSFTAIPTTYKDLILELAGVSLSTSGVINIALTADNSTYTPAVAITPATIASDSLYGTIRIPGYRSGGGSISSVVGNLPSDLTIGGANDIHVPWRVGSGIAGVRLTASAGVFDAGTVTLKARL